MPYNPKAVDVWAVGICLYRCLAGSFPFKGINESDLYGKIKTGLNSYPKDFSSEVKSLLCGMLDINQETRFTATQSLKHSFFHDVSVLEASTEAASKVDH